MTTDSEVMQQALDALEQSVDCVTDEYEAHRAMWENLPTREKQLMGMKALLVSHEAAIAALRQRLT
jgi:hypothetical protein